MTTTVLYPASSDAWLFSQQGTFADALDGIGAATGGPASNPTVEFGSSHPLDWIVAQAFLSFDASSIPDNDEITLVTFTGYAETITSPIDGYIRVKSYPWDWGTIVAAGDWIPPAEWVGLPEYFDVIVDTDPTFFNDTGTDALFDAVRDSQTGGGPVRMVLVNDYIAASAEGESYMVMHSSEGTNPPTLTIEHTGEEVIGRLSVT